MANKRSEQRKIKRLEITYSAYTDDALRGISSNISTSGVFIRTKKPFKPGTPVNISLEINVNNKIELSGITAWSVKTGRINHRDGMGVRLITTPQMYNDFVNELYKN
ncbi:MAG: PilZ domain-containing protein [Nitrospirae bacterium]|nr:PilZ domain-containing protein [Nitrospirota bacterium]